MCTIFFKSCTFCRPEKYNVIILFFLNNCSFRHFAVLVYHTVISLIKRYCLKKIELLVPFRCILQIKFKLYVLVRKILSEQGKNQNC